MDSTGWNVTTKKKNTELKEKKCENLSKRLNWGYFVIVRVSSLFILAELWGFTLQWGISLVFKKKKS